ncbi:energy transducer TonB [Kaistella jeonii]|nr:hypothetical protein [Kaistella jeonii]
MPKKLLYIILLCSSYFLHAQQNEEFVSAKKFFDYQRFMLNNEFKKKFDLEKEVPKKIGIKKDFSEFMMKLDSIQNTAFIGTLIKVKNREDLASRTHKSSSQFASENPEKTILEDQAQYPGGFNTLRKQVADLFYTEAILPDQKVIKTNVVFVVEKDGTISSVHAEGDHFAFNRQAEIAMYLLPEKFSPAIINGTAVRYRFRLPLAMNFE